MKFKLAIVLFAIIAIIGVIIMATSPDENGWIGFLMFVLGIFLGNTAMFCWLDWDYCRRHSEEDDDNGDQE